MNKRIKKYNKKIYYLIEKKKNLNNEPGFLFYLRIFCSESEQDINTKIYPNFNVKIFTTKIIVYCFFYYV